jgi:teichuronic acid biosynthesis glycosyltransferase TuaC
VSLATRFLHSLDRRKLITWERKDPAACVLMVTNAWPHAERPTQGTFVLHTVDGIVEQGVRCDVLLIRGYRGLYVYLLGCVLMLMLSVTSRGKYRIIHCHGGETALVARFFLSVPVLASYLGTDILGPKEGRMSERVKCYVRSKVLRAHALLMDGTTTKSSEMEELLPQRARLRNWVIPDGVDRTQFSPGDRNEARLQLGWSLDEIAVISVGRRVPVKRLWLAECATKLAAQNLPSLRWRALSDVSPKDMPLCYRAADCLIHTSASEGSPNAIKEALACDLPVVATPAGDIPDLLRGVVPSAVCDAEPEKLAHEIVRCTSGLRRSNGRDRTSHLGLEEVARQTLETYGSLGVQVEPTGASNRPATKRGAKDDFVSVSDQD